MNICYTISKAGTFVSSVIYSILSSSSRVKRHGHFSRAFLEFISRASKFQGIYRRNTLYRKLCTSPEGFLSFAMYVPRRQPLINLSLTFLQGRPWEVSWRSSCEVKIGRLASRVTSFLTVYKEGARHPHLSTSFIARRTIILQLKLRCKMLLCMHCFFSFSRINTRSNRWFKVFCNVDSHVCHFIKYTSF